MKKRLWSLREKCPYSEFFWSLFSHIHADMRDTPHLSVFNPNVGKCGQEKLRIRTLFTQWISLPIIDINILNQKSLVYIRRVRREWDERLMFLIRLLNQFMASNVFKDKFIKDGALEYFKIYQSIWEGNVSSFENIRQLVSLYDALESRALNELEQFTGNYSTLVTLSNVISYLKSLNYTDINTVIETYQGVDLELLKNLSYENFIRHVKDILIDIGGIKNEKDESIDWYLKNQLPDIVNKSMTAYGYISKGIHTNVYYLNQGSKYVQKGFNIAREYIGKGQTGENKFLNFTLEVLVPGIDGLFQPKEKSSRESIDVCQGNKCWSEVSATHIAEPKDLCLEVFMSRQDIESPKNTERRETKTESMEKSGDSRVVPVSESVMSFAQKSELALKNSDVLRVSYESFKKSSMCDILNFAKTVREMKKDSYFIYRVFDLIEGIALKRIDEEKNMYLTFLNQVDIFNPLRLDTAQKMKLSIKNFFSKCDQNRSFLSFQWI